MTIAASERDLAVVRHDWTRGEVRALFELPFPELIFRAQRIHRQHFDPAEVQISTLISIKTGGCREDCAYCPQSAHYQTSVKAEKLMRVDAVVAEAQAAKSAGASRFCIGAACIAEVEAFDPQTIQTQDDTSKAVALSASVDGALVQTFGKDTEEYRRYSRARPGWPSHSQIETLWKVFPIFGRDFIPAA